jgi:hypothetical protein
VGALDLASGKVRELMPRSETRDVWSMSADRRYMAYNQYDSSGFSVGVAETGQMDGRVVAASVGSDGSPLSRWVRPRLSPHGDHVLYGRQADLATNQSTPDAGALWVVGRDGTGARKLASLQSIWSAGWGPSGRFIAYTGTVDSATTVLRVVEVATGVQHNISLPERRAKPVRDSGGGVLLMEWSPDGKFIGIVVSETLWEFWAVQGLQ